MSEYYCSNCDTDYETSQKYNYHQKVKWCKKYKNITFTCNTCSYKTKNIKHIEDHNCSDHVHDQSSLNTINTQTCNHNENKISLNTVETQTEFVPDETENLQKIIDQKDWEIQLCELKLTNEYTRAKMEIYERLIRNNTDIKLDETFDVVIPSSDEISKDNIDEDVHDNSKKMELDNEIFPSVNEINTFSLEDINTSIELRTKAFRTHQSFYNAMEDLKRLRTYLMNLVTYENYMKILSEHLTMYKSVLTLKGLSEHDSDMLIINNALLTIETRMIFHRGYLDVTFDPSELYYFDILYDTLVSKPDEYNVPNMECIVNNMCNYSTHVWSLKTVLRRVLNCSNTYNNIIYNPIVTNEKSDPFSFYILYEISDTGKKRWKLDNRLMNLTEIIQDNIVPYLIDKFRYIYFDIFSDNVYRNNYKTDCEYDIVKYELKTICKNILNVSNTSQFRKMLCKLIKDESTYTKTTMDTFNIKEDDKVSKQDVSKLDNSSMENIYVNVRNMFDNISKDNIKNFVFSEIGI